MSYAKRFMMLLTFLLLLLFGASARAQSDVRTPDQKIYFPQLDIVLSDAMWEGNPAGTGMRYDAEAIACMVRACADIQASLPADVTTRCRGLHDETCPYREVRDSGNYLYQLCYAAHQARIKQPGYKRLANPPSMTSLTCSVIAAQKESYDESIYTAVNGHPRQPSALAAQPPAAAKASPKTRLQPGEADALLAELNRSSGSASGRGPVAAYRPRPAPRVAPAARDRRAPVASAVSSSAGLPGFRIVSQNNKETVLRILPGADYYTVEKSFLAKDHQVDSVAVMGYAGNNRAQIFFPYRLSKGGIELYKPRLHLKGDDIKHRLGPMDDATREFISGCGGDACEIRFALQAGETLRIPRNSASSDSVSSAAPRPVAPSQPDTGTEGKAEEPPAPVSSMVAAVPAVPFATPPVVLETVDIAPSASAGVNVSQSAQSSTPRSVDEGVDIPFWATIWTLAFGIIMLMFKWYHKKGRRVPEPEDDELLGGIPGVSIIGLPNDPVANNARPTEPVIVDNGTGVPMTTLRPSTGEPAVPPDPNLNQPGVFAPAPHQKVSNPKAKVIVTTPGGIGPNEPTVLNFVPPQAQQTGAADSDDSEDKANGGLSPPKSSAGST